MVVYYFGCSSLDIPLSRSERPVRGRGSPVGQTRVRKTRVLNHKTQPSGFLRVNPYTHWVAGSDQY